MLNSNIYKCAKINAVMLFTVETLLIMEIISSLLHYLEKIR